MTEQDFRECYYISNEMRFFSYKDFLINCNAIKHLYKNKLGKYGKIFYKWYIYANIDITMSQKNKIWGFLNDDVSKKGL